MNEPTPRPTLFPYTTLFRSKDAKGEPIKGADVRIESRNGKQEFSTVKTDPKGRYISQGLQPGGYRVTLLVNGVVKADRKSTRLNSSHRCISYAVFCLKKKTS